VVNDVANASLAALNESLVNTARFLPNLIAAIVIFVIGVLVAVLVKNALLRLLQAIGFESLLSKCYEDKKDL